MQDLRCITFHFYFKILDCEIFGGKGTEGYIKTSYDECTKLKDENLTIEGFEKLRKTYTDFIAETSNVDINKVIPISKQEYLDNTEDED